VQEASTICAPPPSALEALGDSRALRSRSGGAHAAHAARIAAVACDYIVSQCGAGCENRLSWRLLEERVHDVCAFRAQNVIGTRRSYGQNACMNVLTRASSFTTSYTRYTNHEY
jgi:hypothetical protein